jgi:hypothetical protein
MGMDSPDFSTTNICGTDDDFDRPSGTRPVCIANQALRAWLQSTCPSGTKAIRPLYRLTIILALMGLKPWEPSTQSHAP